MRILRSIWRNLIGLPSWTEEIASMRSEWAREEAAALDLSIAIRDNGGGFSVKSITRKHDITRQGLINAWWRLYGNKCPVETAGETGVRIAWERSIESLLGNEDDTPLNLVVTNA
jgi:hypothetical protein